MVWLGNPLSPTSTVSRKLVMFTGYLYVQTELCTGGNLRDFIAFCEGRRIPEECLWTIINHVGQGLEALHANQIVHLDIKPENIFVAADGAIKIGDLGMAAQNSSAQKRVDDLEGDAMYMAKELLSSAVRYPSADVFCLGKDAKRFPSSLEGWLLSNKTVAITRDHDVGVGDRGRITSRGR
jgi:serine/threonine protein kinase